jgi:hypothetical protein
MALSSVLPFRAAFTAGCEGGTSFVTRPHLFGITEHSLASTFLPRLENIVAL